MLTTTQSLTELCGELRNWFDRDQWVGRFTIRDGTLTGMTEKLLPGQYFRIIGSVLNEGVHRYQDGDLEDETFDGAVWPMVVPPEVLRLADEIGAWRDKNDAFAASPLASESFTSSGYSYTMKGASSGAAGNGGTTSWQGAFRSRLARWRRYGCPCHG